MNNKYHIFKPDISKLANLIGAGTTEIGPFTKIENYVLLDSGNSKLSSIIIGKRCKIKQGAILKTYDGEINLGDRVTVGEYSIIAGHGKISIGDCTMIAGKCYISASNHIICKNEISRFLGETALGITIGANVWIGMNTSIIDGVNIGEGSVIGAGSVVTRDIPPNTICFGVPCRVIREK